MITFTTQSGLPVAQGVRQIFQNAMNQMSDDFPNVAGSSMQSTVRSWFSTRFPGSTYWSPSKVNKSFNDSKENEAIVNVDVPGASRAYANVTIRPKEKQFLAIPLHRDAYGKKPEDFTGLFKPKGKFILAYSDKKGHLVPMFALAIRAYQKQDQSLMPSDESLASNIFKALCPTIDQTIDDAVKHI